MFIYIPLCISVPIYICTSITLLFTLLWGIIIITRKILDMTLECETLQTELNDITVK